MGLDSKNPGSDAFRNQKINGSLNPGGRPKGSMNKKSHAQVKERLLGKWQTHPVDRLVQLANHVMLTDPKLAAEIWTNLLKYFEPTKKPVESAPEKTTPEDSKLAAEETHRMLEELEKNGKFADTPSGEGTGLADGTTQIPS